VSKFCREILIYTNRTDSTYKPLPNDFKEILSHTYKKNTTSIVRFTNV